MAVETESFSIREYTERMRRIDSRRCWPFEDRNEARPLLPSISVRRFKWWGDELDSARSTVVVEEEDYPRNDVAVAAISDADDIQQRPRTAMEPFAAVTTGEEGRPTANKAKQRMPKKRSIVELFAVAPLIAGTVEADEANSDEGERWENEDTIEEEEEEEEEIGVVMRKKMAMKENIIKKKKRRMKMKNKGIEDGLKAEIRAWGKEKICKPKMLSSVQSYMFQNPVCGKKSRETARSFAESQKQPLKETTARKKHKVLRTSKLSSRKQEVAKKLPAHSILKNQKRGATDLKSSKPVNAKAANLIKFNRKSNRHVSFSVKDDIVGNGRACSSMDFPRLQNLCKIFSDVLAASSVMNHSSKGHDLPDANEKPHEANACEKGTHSSVVSRIEAPSTEKNQSTDSNVNLCQPTVVNSSNSSCSGAERAPFAVMVDLNHAIDADDIDCSISAISTSSSDPNSRVTFHEKNPNSTSDIHLEVSLTRSSEPSLVPAPNGEFFAGSDVKSSMKLQKNLASHSSTIVYKKTNEKQCQPHVDADVNFCRPMEELQSGGHRSPKGLLGNKCYSMGSKKFRESLGSPHYGSTTKSRCPGEDFVGLPLNSQGELIQFHSGTKFNEAYNKQNMEWGSIHGFSANRHVESKGRMNHLEIMRKKFAGAASFQKNQSDWNQKPYYSTRERVRNWLNFTELDRSERLKFQKNEPVKGKDIFLHCNSNPRNHSFHEYRNGDGTRDNHSQPAVQPTMRLMGKNVVVSGINRDYNGFNEGRTWNHNENLAQQTQFAMSENPRTQQWMQRECVSHPTIGMSKGNLLDLLDSPQKFYHMKALEPTLDYMNITQQPQWPSRSTDPAIVNHTFKLDMTKLNPFLGNCMPGEASISTGHRFPAVIASHPQNFHQHMLLSSSLSKHNQRASTSQSQFKYPDFGKFSQPPLLQPAANLPQWLLHEKHQKRTQLPDPHHSDPNSISQPCNVSGTSSNYRLSLYHVPMIPSSSRGGADYIKAHRPFVSNACTPSIIPPAASTKPSGDVNERNISMKKKEKEGIYSKFTSFKSPTDAQKHIKRPADFDDGMMNCAERPLKGQLDSHVPEEPKETEQINEETSLEVQNTANENGSCRSVNGSDSLNFDGESRSGPTKLIAGAKHILKPSQRMDEENCRRIHSTIIVSSTDDSGKSFGPEKKISNIYKF